MSNKIKLILKILVSVILLSYIFLSNDLNNILSIISTSDLSFLLISILLIIVNYIFSSIRWYFLLLEKEKPPLEYLIKLYFVGSFFNNFLLSVSMIVVVAVLLPVERAAVLSVLLPG